MPFIFEWEGEIYEHDSDDPGGATKFGIDQRSHPNVDIRNLTKEQATEIYWKEWQEDGCDKKGSPFAEVFFNCAVNMGYSRAKQFDRGVKDEDSKTFLDLQESYYRRLANGHRNFQKYLKGWLNRTNALRERFGLLAA